MFRQFAMLIRLSVAVSIDSKDEGDRFTAENLAQFRVLLCLHFLLLLSEEVEKLVSAKPASS